MFFDGVADQPPSETKLSFDANATDDHYLRNTLLD